MHEYRYTVGYYQACEGMSGLQANILAARDMAVARVVRATCALLGHRWVGTGWAGNDSGGDGADCTRCGESWTVTFY